MKNLEKLLSRDLQSLIIIAQNEVWEELTDRIKDKYKVEKSDVVECLASEGVQELRKKIAGLNIKPHSSEFRLLFIFSLDRMNKAQANTLLKTIEEPPAYAKIFILAESFSKVLPTVKSRCQKVILPKVEGEAESQFLKYFKELDFNQFCRKLKAIENEAIPDILKSVLEELRAKKLDSLEVKFFQKIGRALIRIESSNSSRKLALEELYIWYRANKNSR